MRDPVGDAREALRLYRRNVPRGTPAGIVEQVEEVARELDEQFPLPLSPGQKATEDAAGRTAAPISG